MDLFNQLLLQAAAGLKKRGFRIAFAESASAGFASHAFSSVPDAGSILLGGIVCYDACIKESVLRVPAALIERYTPESLEVTRAMAEACQRMFGADLAIAITGLTTPGGSESHEKPVGTMFVHICGRDGHWARRFIFSGGPAEIVMRTTEAVAGMLVNALDAS